jgi:chromate transporter
MGTPVTGVSTQNTRPSLRAVTWYFLKLGAVGFGGPIALAGAMQRTLVDDRRWLSREDYLEGLALAQLAPGPLAAQLAMYIGYLSSGVVGATAVGVAFILPSFLLVWLLAVAYVHYGGLWWMQGLFYGIGAAVIGIIARSASKLARATLARDRLLWTIAIVMTAVTALTARENIWLLLLSGLIPVGAHAVGSGGASAVASGFPPSRGFGETRRSAKRVGGSRTMFLAVTSLPASKVSLLSLGWFFTRAGAFVFGSGLAVVPFLYGGIVMERHWLTDQQFLDAVAVAMITPGPVVITVAFIGYLVRGVPGMTVAALGVFLPAYLVVVLAAPWFRRNHHKPGVKAFVSGVTAAATGAIAGASIVLGRRALIDPLTVGLAAVTLLVLARWRISELWLIAAGGAAGLCLR